MPNITPEAILSGNRRAMGKAITLLESKRPDLFQQGQDLLEALLPHTGKALRIGITGAPGVGKSTFIESFGLYLIEQGHRVAVLAVDPSSPVTGGSIMGDKTRMNELAVHPNAFIRPSPSSGILGGVAPKTRETMLLCEAAGYDVVFVETDGVGQSETLVASIVDLFLVLMLPNAGDELQGIKKGVLELADLVVINKADGVQESMAKSAQSEYSRALHLLAPAKNSWNRKVLRCSALQKEKLEDVWDTIQEYQQALQKTGEWDKQRKGQTIKWMWSLVEAGLRDNLMSHPNVLKQIPTIESSVETGTILPTRAAKLLLDYWSKH